MARTILFYRARPVEQGRLAILFDPGGPVPLALIALTTHHGRTNMDLISTLPGSMMEGFFPAGWDLAKIDRLAAAPPEALGQRQRWWHPQFEPVACASFEDFDTYMGHEIAREVQS